MSTVSKEIADRIIDHNGVYPGDEHLPPYVRIVEYTNAWGALAYGLERKHEIGKYDPSPYVRDPKTYWFIKN